MCMAEAADHLLLGQSFLSCLLRWKERDMVVEAPSEEPPRHRVLPCPPGAHVSWEHKGGEGKAAPGLTKCKPGSGEQELC